MVSDDNIILGLAIAFFGLALSLSAHILLGNIPLTAMGIGLAIVGVAWALTPSHPLPRKTVLDIIESSCDNIEALLEFLGATRKAIYLPLAAEARVMAYVPLAGAKDAEGLSLKEVADDVGKIVVRRGEVIGVFIAPPKVKFLGGNPGFEDSGGNIESLLDYVFVDSEIAESVRVARSEDGLVIEVCKVRVNVNYPRFNVVLGSLPSCLAAQVVAAALSRPVQVVSEKVVGDKLIINLRFLDWTEPAYI